MKSRTQEVAQAAASWHPLPSPLPPEELSDLVGRAGRLEGLAGKHERLSQGRLSGPSVLAEPQGWTHSGGPEHGCACVETSV